MAENRYLSVYLIKTRLIKTRYLKKTWFFTIQSQKQWESWTATREGSRTNSAVLFYVPKMSESKLKVWKTVFPSTFGIRKDVVDITMTKKYKQIQANTIKKGRHAKKQIAHEIGVEISIEKIPEIKLEAFMGEYH